MDPLDILPARPLGQAEREQVRAHDDVEVLTIIGTASIHRRYPNQTESATSAVVLVDGTVYALEFDDAEWSAEVLQRNADRRDHLDQALDRLP